MIKKIVLLLSLIILCKLSFAETHEMTLDNGLKILVLEDHRVDVVVQQLWYGVGSIDDPMNKSGLSHVLEHMMFRGTESVPAGEYSRTLSRLGGRENAMTGASTTVYYQTVASEYLPEIMHLEADRMYELSLNKSELDREIQVIKEERRSRVENRPKALFFEKFLQYLYPEDGRNQPVTGYLPDLDNITLSDVKLWYGQWYQPDNATLVVAGNVESEDVFALAKKYFLQVKTKNINVPVKDKLLSTQTPNKPFNYVVDGQDDYLLLAYQLPNFSDKKSLSSSAYAFEVLANILAGGNSSRLTKVLEEEQSLALKIGMKYRLYNTHSSLLLISLVPAKEVSLDALQNAFIKEIESIAQFGVTASELEKVKAQVMANHVFSMDSLFSRAMNLGKVHASGFDIDNIDHYVERINEVSAMQIKDIAKKYLSSNQLIAARLHSGIKK